MRVTSCCLASTSRASPESAAVLDVVLEACSRVPECQHAYGGGDLAQSYSAETAKNPVSSAKAFNLRELERQSQFPRLAGRLGGGGSAPTGCLSPPRLAPRFSAACAPRAIFSTGVMFLARRPNPSCCSMARSSNHYSSSDRTQNSAFESYTNTRHAKYFANYFRLQCAGRPL